MTLDAETLYPACVRVSGHMFAPKLEDIDAVIAEMYRALEEAGYPPVLERARGRFAWQKKVLPTAPPLGDAAQRGAPLVTAF